MNILKDKIHKVGLKATPQRLAVYSTMKKLGHASVDMVVEDLSLSFPTLTVATIYNVLESFVECGLIVRRFSSNNKMYFDVNTYNHAHLYDENTNCYVDYNDPDLIKLVTDYLKNKNIDSFNLKDVDIQLIGKFI